MKDDIINKPNHYHKNNIDVIKFYINKLIELNN
jgi:hypothetical protein